MVDDAHSEYIRVVAGVPYIGVFVPLLPLLSTIDLPLLVGYADESMLLAGVTNPELEHKQFHFLFMIMLVLMTGANCGIC